MALNKNHYLIQTGEKGNMATHGMFTAANGQHTEQVRVVLLNYKNPKTQEAERKAAEMLGIDVERKRLCLGHHDPNAAQVYLVIPAGSSYGKKLAKKITYAGQLIKTGNPNGKELFPE